MPSTWPGTVPAYTTKVDITDVVQAAHPNQLQSDIQALAISLGTNPSISTSVGSGSVFNASSNTYTDVKGRMANIENGITGDSHAQYVRITGGSTITPIVNGTVGIRLQAKVGSTANQTEWYTSAGVLVSWVDSTGVFNSNSGVFATASDVDNLRALFHMGI